MVFIEVQRSNLSGSLYEGLLYHTLRRSYINVSILISMQSVVVCEIFC